MLSFEPRFSCTCSYDFVLSFRWWFSFTAIPFLWIPCLHLDFLALFFSLTNIARLFGMITVMFLHFVYPIYPGVCFLYADLKSVVWYFLGPKFVLLAASIFWMQCYLNVLYKHAAIPVGVFAGTCCFCLFDLPYLTYCYLACAFACLRIFCCCFSKTQKLFDLLYLLHGLFVSVVVVLSETQKVSCFSR